MDMIEVLRRRVLDARAVGDSDFEQTTLSMFLALEQRLEDALRKYADKIVEAACCNNAQRLRELHDGLRALRTCLVEWRLVAAELGVFSQASASGSVSGGDGCCCPSPVAASFTSEEVSDA